MGGNPGRGGPRERKVSPKLAGAAVASQPARERTRWGAAALSGILQALAFPPVGASWIALVALIPLFWALFGPRAAGEPRPSVRRQFLLAFAAEAVYFALLLHWILFLSNQEVTVPGLMIPALLFMAAYLAVFFAAAVAASAGLERLGGVPAVITVPVFWTLADRLRSAGALAFPWGSLGYAFSLHPAVLQGTAWTGFWGLPLWVLAVNAAGTAALLALLERNRPRFARAAALAVVLAAAPVAFGAAVLARAPAQGREYGTGDGLRLALLQPNTPREIKWKKGFEGIVTDDLLDRTRKAAALGPDLVVWPETAAPVMILWDPQLAERVHSVLGELGKYVLVGTLDATVRPGGGADYYNAALLYDPKGVPVTRYYKCRLVPFSEAMPFQKQIPWMNALNFGQSDFSAGKERTEFTVHGKTFSVLICFESIFPDEARKSVLGGAQYLINTTNDFWFGRSAGPVQHAEMAIHRAVENRTPLARCANTGISFFVDPYGRVTQRTGLFVEAMPVAQPGPGSGGSFYTRHGDWIVRALIALAALSAGSAWWSRRTTR